MYSIYTDGSAILNESAGYGFVILSEKEEILYQGCGKITTLPLTAQHAEVLAAYYAIQKIHELFPNDITNIDITLYSDSLFMVKTMTEWGPKRKNWTGKAYANYFIPLLNWVKFQKRINFIHIPGHQGIKYNEMADSLAKSGRNQ